MKSIRIVLALLLGFFVFNVNAQDDLKKADSKDGPVITFEKETHDFGTIKEGDVVETTFKFTNTGNAPLLITRIKATCGCTVPKDWKKTAIQPGEKSSFNVKFNSRNKPNKNNKRITITSNAIGNNYTNIKANVIPDPELQKLREDRRKAANERRKIQLSKGNALKSDAQKSDKKSSLKLVKEEKKDDKK